MGVAAPETPRARRTRKVSAAELLGIVERGGPLIIGARDLRCPGCEAVADILSYLALECSDKYADQVVRPLKCRSCRHVFALKP